MANGDERKEIVEVQGEALTPMDSFWLEAARGAAKESVKALEEAAKQLITVTTLAQGIYFAAVSFGDVKAALGGLNAARQWTVAVVLVVPLIFWLLSLAFATRVFKPESYSTSMDSPDMARKVYENIVAYKSRQLVRAYGLLAAGFVPLIVNVVLYLMFVPSKPS